MTLKSWRDLSIERWCLTTFMVDINLNKVYRKDCDTKHVPYIIFESWNNHVRGIKLRFSLEIKLIVSDFFFFFLHALHTTTRFTNLFGKDMEIRNFTALKIVSKRIMNELWKFTQYSSGLDQIRWFAFWMHSSSSSNNGK